MKLRDSFGPWVPPAPLIDVSPVPPPDPVPDPMDEREGEAGNEREMSFSPELSPPEAVPLAVPEAISWLDTHLTQPRRVAEVVSEWTGGQQRKQRNGALRWEGGRDGTHGHWLADLVVAQRCLGITAYVGQDAQFWWSRAAVSQPQTPPETKEAA